MNTYIFDEMINYACNGDIEVSVKAKQIIQDTLKLEDVKSIMFTIYREEEDGCCEICYSREVIFEYEDGYYIQFISNYTQDANDGESCSVNEY